jgi:peptidyl-prolyl cis-trans isomerase D
MPYYPFVEKKSLLSVLLPQNPKIPFLYFTKTIIFASLKIFEQMSSNEKKVENTENKKDSVSVLEKIRRRTGLLVGIVGLALVIFILESLLSSGRSIFGGNDMTSLGKINGKTIDRNEFVMKVENQLNVLRQQRQTQDIDEQTRGQVLDYVWNQYVNELVIKPQFEKIGINVGEDEIYDRVVVNPLPSISQRLIDQKTGKIYEQLAGPAGNLDPAKWKQFVQNAQGDQEAFVKEMEENVKSTRQLEKYSSLIRKGIYITNAEAKEGLKKANTQLTFNYVAKRYDAVSDSVVKLNDADIQKYYSDHTYEFTAPETTRKIEYVAFNLTPSPEDVIALEKDAQRAASEFTAKTMADDSVYIAQESENGNVMIQDFTRKTMPVRDSAIYTANIGAIYGPYNEGAYLKIYKLEKINTVADSARVRHILIGTSDPQSNQQKKSFVQAKREADSLLVLIKEKKVTFDTLVKTVSDDGGSKSNGGDYGWFDENKGFVEPFKMAGLMGTVGNISVVQTQFGYHIIEVLDVSKTNHKSYKIAQIFKLIAPSEETNQKIFTQANEFGGKNNTAELFDKAVDAQKLSKRVADNIKEGDRQLPGIDQPKELVRWVYTAKKGDISVFSFNDKHLVVKLAAIKNKGVLPLEDVKEEVVVKATAAKKAEMIAAEFKTKAGSSNNVAEIASKMGLEVKTIEKMPAASHSIDGLGHDDVFVGTLLGTKTGATSKIVEGKMGVFVLALNSAEKGNIPEDINLQKKSMEQEIGGRSEYEVMNVLKELAEIEDHKSKID